MRSAIARKLRKIRVMHDVKELSLSGA